MTRKKPSGPVVVSLYDVVAEMDLPSDDWVAYLNRRTGELVTVTDEEQRIADADEEPDDLPDWQQETLPKVREVLESEDFLPLPGKFEIHEYRIMERFCLGVEDVEARGELLQAIRGRGAFRRFKEVIHDRDIAEAWYACQQRALEEIAIGWLEANGIAYSREKRPHSDTSA